MNTVPARAAAVPVAPLSSVSTPDPAASIIAAAHLLLPHLERGQKIDAVRLRTAMEAAFGASDASGAWTWKTAYDACEAATVLFLRKYGSALFRKTGSPTVALPMLARIAALLPTHTRRSEESQTFQQFSTPVPLGLAAVTAAALTPADRVLEPSAGTGLLAALAGISSGSLILNELAETRAAMLEALFPGLPVSRFDAAQIHDHLDPALVPSVVVMNPPFSVMANVSGRMADAALRHVASALARLADGGRLVTITGANFGPDRPAWRESFVRLQEKGRIVFTAAIDGAVYAKHGTTFETRLIVIDKVPADDPTAFPESAGIAPDVATLLEWIGTHVPPRPPVAASIVIPRTPPAVIGVRTPRRPPAQTVISIRPASLAADPDGMDLAYEAVEWKPADDGAMTEAIYEEYGLQTIRIPDAQPHPSTLVQSAAMASVAPPSPSYRPCLPPSAITDGLLSDAQLETVIYAGAAHSEYLAGSWTVDETFDMLSAVTDDTEGAVRFRRGFFLGDGTGAGKGRQVAGIILDHWLRGRKKAVWLSKSETLIEDAQRDWSGLGMERLLVTPLSRFKQGNPITLKEGILFATYATLRTEERGIKVSRVEQIVQWLGKDFDGVIVFDESHMMANAAASKGERGEQGASQQGRAGLRLQHALPDARIVYVSATGATTVSNLAYAQRLGLWGGADFPFATRADFMQAVEAGGVAAMEVLARDLRALGLYMSRSLSYEGIEYELVEHALTPEQIVLYDAYAGAFQIIHNNLTQALEATNITGSSGTLNAQAKSAARSAFESAKQRFFNHLLTGMKTPTLIRSIEGDLEDGHAPVIQIVSTGEALMERRLAEIPTEEWNDIRIDITPRETIMDYLLHAFPVQLYEPYTDEEGKLYSRPVVRDGQPVESREAVACRDRLIEDLASLPPVPGALDAIVQHFGTDVVAEVTGRSRRIIRRKDWLMVENRAGSANLDETAAFMDDQKRILIFSDAGGTGRSYHASLTAKNQRLRVHYLLEPGWKADAAIQGLGRTNRTHQAQPPLFRPVATNVKAEKRFLSTIARRLDTLGAITRGQRQTGGQGLFRPEDNLESIYAWSALQQLYRAIVRGQLEGCSLQEFETATGLDLSSACGISEDLPPMRTFLNRLLALKIDLQGILFEAFEGFLNARVEAAIANGTYDVGLETLQAESFVVTDRETIHVHPGTGAETRLLTIVQKKRSAPVTVEEALKHSADAQTRLLINERSGRVAVAIPTSGVMQDDGSIEPRLRLIRPTASENVTVRSLNDNSHWTEADPRQFVDTWKAELATVPEFVESTLYMVAGLLLPIWTRLPTDSSRVYRLQTDDGERIIGRKVSAAWVASTLSVDKPTLNPQDAFTTLMEGKTVLTLAEGLELRRVRVMNQHRIELCGFGGSMREQLRAYGLFSEIITHQLRMFIPTDAEATTVLTRIMERFPLERIVLREAA